MASFVQFRRKRTSATPDREVGDMSNLVRRGSQSFWRLACATYIRRSAATALVAMALGAACNVTHQDDVAQATDELTAQCPDDADAHFVPDQPNAPTSAAGITPGSFNVTDSGDARYSVPIRLPPGRAGVQPEIAVIYSSGQGPGLLGVGFGLDGFSSVARCGSNLADDGIRREVRYDEGDHFCLDGLRLVPIADGSNEFRTQPDTFSRVRAIYDPAQPGKGPRAFKVWTRSGRIREYGGRLDAAGLELTSRIRARNGVIRVWAISRESDHAGNFTSFTYDNLPSLDSNDDYTTSYSPSKIAYTGHQSEGASRPDLEPQRSVEFEYFEKRQNSIVRFSRGMELLDHRVLSAINVRVAGTLVRSYHFQYEPVVHDDGSVTITPSGRTRLTSLQEFSRDNVGLPPTTFQWHDGPTAHPRAGFDKRSISLPPFFNPTIEYQFDIVDHPLGDWTAADLNGDGLQDLVVAEPVKGRLVPVPEVGGYRINNYSVLHSVLARPTGDFPGAGPATAVLNDSFYKTKRIVPTDYNQDGKVDLLLDKLSGGVFFLESRTDNFAPPVQIDTRDGTHGYVDLNGDGVTDLVTCWTDADKHDHLEIRFWTVSTDPATGKRVQGWAPGFDPALPNIRCASLEFSLDVNGDGSDDILLPTTSDPTGAVDGNAPLTVVAYDGVRVQSFDSGLTLSQVDAPQVVDANGDGLVDIVSLQREADPHITTGIPQLFINVGGAFRRQFPAGPKVDRTVWSGAVVLDANGDGFSDILIRRTAQIDLDKWVLLLGTETVGFSVIETDIPGTVVSLRKYAANGGVDSGLLGLQDNAFVAYGPRIDLADRLSEIREGLAGRDPTVAISYARLVDQNVAEPTDTYRKTWTGSLCAYPLACVVGGRAVVASYALANGDSVEGQAPSTSNYAMRYRDGRFDRLGRGWLGFSQVRRDEEPGFATSGDPSPSTDIGSVARYFDNETYDPATRRFPNAGRVRAVVQTMGKITDISASCERTMSVHTYEERVQRQGRTYFTFEKHRKEIHYRQPVACLNVFGLPRPGDIDSESDTSSDVDDFGNPTSVDTTVTGLTRTTTQTVAYRNDAGDAQGWLLGLPELVTECSSEVVDGAVDRRCRNTHHTYDDIGLLKVEEISEPGNEHFLRTTYERDAFGNVTSTDQLGTQLQLPLRRSTCAVFDRAEAIFPTVTGIGGDLVRPAVTYTKYEPNFGVISQAVDPNGARTLRAFDGLGRLATETKADGTVTSLVWSTSGTLNRFLDVDVLVDGTSQLQMEYDARLRPVVRKTFPVGQTEPSTETVQYDRRGFVQRHGFPALARATSVTESFAHDALGRLLARIPEDNSATRYRYAGLTTTVTDGRGKAWTTRSDAAGRLVEMSNPNNGKTTYVYGPFDTTVRSTDPAGNATLTLFDDYGWLRATSDADRGTQRFAYNSYGAMNVAIDAKEQTTVNVFDGLGRLVVQSRPEGLVAQVWDVAEHGIGKLALSLAPGGILESFAYDSLGRVQTGTLSIDGESFTTTRTYNPAGALGAGQPDVVTYPAGFAVRYGYDARRRPTTITNAETGDPIWQWTRADGSHRITGEKLGNGVTTSRVFSDLEDGVLKSIRTKSPARDGLVQDLEYRYDPNRNLTQRADRRFEHAHKEDFCYDNLNRLTGADVDLPLPCGPEATRRYAYDASGNLTLKSDLGVIRYDGSHPHAATSAGAEHYDYDANGDQIRRPMPGPTAPHGEGTLANVVYTSFHKPAAYLAGELEFRGRGQAQRCSQGRGRPGDPPCFCYEAGGRNVCSDRATVFEYDATGQRVRKQAPDGETIYAGGSYERFRAAGSRRLQHRYLIRSPERVVAVVTRTSGADSVLFVHTDHSGSVDIVTNQSGALVERRSYDPFGQPRDPNWTTPPASAPFGTAVPVGFTGHEEDAEVRLVNMQGRIYDPQLARFLSPDPGRQHEPDQARNPFSYVRNNPLTLTDPSGYQEQGLTGYNDPTAGYQYQYSERLASNSNIPNINNVDVFSRPDGLTYFVYGWVDYAGQNEANLKLKRDNETLARMYQGESYFQAIGGGKVPNVGPDLWAKFTEALKGAADAISQATPTQVVQVGLTGLGFVPGPVGMAANLVNAGFELYQGNYAAAGLLAASVAIPGAATVVKEFRAGAALAGEAGAVAAGGGMLSDAALVCRGGTCTAERFLNGSGVVRDAAGKLSGVSVNVGEGTLEEVAATLRYKQVGVSTVGDVRSAGGLLTPKPTPLNPLHHELSGLSAETLEQLFTPTVRNPNF